MKEPLEGLSDDELAKVELLGETGLHWKTRHVDFRIVGLMAGIFGNARFMEAARRGGEARSEVRRPPLARTGGGAVARQRLGAPSIV